MAEKKFWQFVGICHLPNHGNRKVAAHKLKLVATLLQVKNILMKDFDSQVKFDVFVVSMAT